MIRQKRNFVLVCLMLYSGYFACAQPGGGSGGPGDGPPAPIGGIEYLVGAGAIYGLKRIIGNRKK